MFVFQCIIVGIGVWTVWYVCFSMYYRGNWCVDSVVWVFSLYYSFCVTIVLVLENTFVLWYDMPP